MRASRLVPLVVFGLAAACGSAAKNARSPDGGAFRGTGVGKPSWVSNPYLEKGAPNAQSNCIGCHQHAGTNENSESILFAPDKFPQAARTRVRKNFPADYLWAVTSAPERLAGVIDDQVKHYDQVDR